MFIKEGARIFSDGSQKPWACCLEAKGLKGIGGKKIMMEAFRTTPLDPEWLDDPRRLNLRPELVRMHNTNARNAFIQAWLASLPPLKEGEARPSPPEFEPILFNINCFAGSDAVATPEEEDVVRGLHKEMIEQQLPQLVARFAEGVITPLDGFGLVQAMHGEGINVRWGPKTESAPAALLFYFPYFFVLNAPPPHYQILAFGFQMLPVASFHRQHCSRYISHVPRAFHLRAQ